MRQFPKNARQNFPNFAKSILQNNSLGVYLEAAGKRRIRQDLPLRRGKMCQGAGNIFPAPPVPAAISLRYHGAIRVA
jgi:hypothetical protein